MSVYESPLEHVRRTLLPVLQQKGPVGGVDSWCHIFGLYDHRVLILLLDERHGAGSIRGIRGYKVKESSSSPYDPEVCECACRSGLVG